jgi:trimeric autotransporter adhesin
MGRSSAIVRLGLIFLCVVLIAALTSCSSSSPTTNTNFPTPANITLSPANTVSLDVGSATQSFSASPRNNKNVAITTPVTFQSSNTAVLTISSNGLACAGTWDSLAAPQICTPGPVGVAQVTATSHGISSPPTTVYVHQHVDKIVVSPVPGQTPPTGACFSKDQIFDYQATAFSQGLDVTASVGPFAWQSDNTDVATFVVATTEAPQPGLATGQVKVTAHTPGITTLFASTSNVTGQPLVFSTCAVQSIALTVSGSATNTINVTSGTGKTVTATVFDTQNNPITGVPLTWSSSAPGTVTVSSEGVVTTSQAGGGTVVASCTPPTCNIGIAPLLPIYPESAVNFVVAAAATTTTTTTTTTPTVYIASTGVSTSPRGNCATTSGCVSLLIPLISPNNTVGAAVGLPATPNSLVFDRQGAKAYMGTDYSFFGSRGLMQVTVANPPTITQFKSVTGKVLSVSPDGTKVILSGADPDVVPLPGSTTPPPSTQVIVFNTTAGTGTTLPIAGATAADFSPDNLKVFITAGSNLYVYSTQDALRQIALPAAAPAVQVSPEGAFAFLAGGSTTSAFTAYSTCALTSALTNDVVLPSAPSFFKALAGDAPNLAVPPFTPPPPFTAPTTTTAILAVDSPGIDVFRVARAPTGCSSTATAGTATSFNLGRGNFVATQLIVSQDETRAFIIASDRGSVLVLNIGNQTSSAIPLAGDAVPIQASLTPDGTVLYVAAADGQVHVLDTESGGDILQISFPTDPTTFQAGLCNGSNFTCNPNLIAVKP